MARTIMFICDCCGASSENNSQSCGLPLEWNCIETKRTDGMLDYVCRQILCPKCMLPLHKILKNIGKV